MKNLRKISRIYERIFFFQLSGCNFAPVRQVKKRACLHLCTNHLHVFLQYMLHWWHVGSLLPPMLKEIPQENQKLSIAYCHNTSSFSCVQSTPIDNLYVFSWALLVRNRCNTRTQPQCSLHLTLHFEECPGCVIVNCEFIF